MEHISKNLDDTKNIAGEIAARISGEGPQEVGATVVGLYGDLGSGKTTFMKSFAKEFGVVEETIQSPTFIIMRIFEIPSPVVPARLTGVSGGGESETSSPGRSGSESHQARRGEVFKKLIHIDAYRLESGEELLKLGWKELISHPGNLICIEWPEKVLEIMPKHFMLRFEHGEREDERKISQE